MNVLNNQPTKTVLFILTFLLFSLPGILNAQQEKTKNEDSRTINLMCYNLKFASPDYKPSWEVRREMQVDMIRKYSPDIIGTQEGLKEQVDYLMDHLPEYIVVGEGRKGGDDDEHMAIFFKRDKFRLREMGSFQLSETPKIIMERINSLNRFGVWTKERPVFLMGDFNSKPGSDVYKKFVGDENSDDADLLDDSVEGGLGIDWILHKGNVKVLSYEKVNYNVNGAYPSDHKPVFVKILINK